jgi:hypothetical protein
LMIFVKVFPRLESAAPFFLLMVLHFECPDMRFARLFSVAHDPLSCFKKLLTTDDCLLSDVWWALLDLNQ